MNIRILLKNFCTKTVLAGSLASAAALAVIILSGGTVTAATYPGGANLIDNIVFRDTSTMSKSEIQSFLSSKGSGLKDMSFRLDCYGQDSKEREWYTNIGAPCDQNVPASHIIYYASRIYGINPQVILATLQKEQSLVTTPNPTSWQLDNAMGYGCPTTGSCSSTGFYRQIDYGTWVLRYHYERAKKNHTWWNNNSNWTCGSEKNFYKPNLYPGNNVRFYDGNGVHYRTYKLANAATSALYCYTPHAYNNPNGINGTPKYGTKGQYYSGSYWFFVRFSQWFGSPFGEADAIYRLFNSNSNNHLYTKSRNERDKAVREANFRYEGKAFEACPVKGKWIYRMYNPVTGRHLFTASYNEWDKAARETNFKKEGVAFEACGSKPVYRLYSAPEQKHFYTVSKSERDKLVRETSFVYEGIAFRVH